MIANAAAGEAWLRKPGKRPNHPGKGEDTPRRAEGQARGYPSDLSYARWQVIAPHLPVQRLGRPVDETHH